MGNRARGANATLRAAFEAVYGTPPDAGVYFTLPFVSSDLGEEQQLLASDLLGAGREPLAPTLDVINNTGSPVVPVDVRNIGYWLTLYFGQPVTAASVAAAGSIKFAAQPAAASTITINGQVFTFVAAAPGANEILIGANTNATVTAIAAALNASAVVGVARATYTGVGPQLNIVADALGLTDNGFTLAASAPSNGTVSGPTLTGGANSHTFTSGAQQLPSLTAEVGFPEVPFFGVNFGIRGNTLKVALARSGLLNATLGLIAKGETPGVVTIDAAPSELDVRRFSQFLGAIERNGVALGSVASGDFQYSNDLDPVDTIQGDGRIEDADAGTVGMTGSIVTRFKDTILLDQATNGDPCEVSFGWTIDPSASLIVTVHAVYFPRAKKPVTGPKGIQLTYPYQAAKDDTGKTVTIVLTNDVAGATYAAANT